MNCAKCAYNVNVLLELTELNDNRLNSFKIFTTLISCFSVRKMKKPREKWFADLYNLKI